MIIKTSFLYSFLVLNGFNLCYCDFCVQLHSDNGFIRFSTLRQFPISSQYVEHNCASLSFSSNKWHYSDSFSHFCHSYSPGSKFVAQAQAGSVMDNFDVSIYQTVDNLEDYFLSRPAESGAQLLLCNDALIKLVSAKEGNSMPKILIERRSKIKIDTGSLLTMEQSCEAVIQLNLPVPGSELELNDKSRLILTSMKCAKSSHAAETLLNITRSVVLSNSSVQIQNSKVHGDHGIMHMEHSSVFMDDNGEIQLSKNSMGPAAINLVNSTLNIHGNGSLHSSSFSRLLARISRVDIYNRSFFSIGDSTRVSIAHGNLKISESSRMFLMELVMVDTEYSTIQITEKSSLLVDDQGLIAVKNIDQDCIKECKTTLTMERSDFYAGFRSAFRLFGTFQATDRSSVKLNHESNTWISTRGQLTLDGASVMFLSDSSTLRIDGLVKLIERSELISSGHGSMLAIGISSKLILARNAKLILGGLASVQIGENCTFEITEGSVVKLLPYSFLSMKDGSILKFTDEASLTIGKQARFIVSKGRIIGDKRRITLGERKRAVW